MDRRVLFINTMNDLKSRSNSHNEYEILMISGLLRKLLMDSDPLMNQMNRYLKLKIRFRINDVKLSSETPIPLFQSIGDDFDPGIPPLFPKNEKEVTLDQFLKIEIMEYRGHRINIGELIQHMAHIEGAIHPGVPKEKKEEIMKELVETIGIGGFPAGIRIMKSITNIVIKGLSELEREIIEKN